jgi:mitogen-activated protein kinase 15
MTSNLPASVLRGGKGNYSNLAQTGRRHPDYIDKVVHESYEVGTKIGRGCYGNVFKIVRKKTGKEYALKKIMDAFRNTTDAQRTYREVAYMVEFAGHSNVLQLFEVMKSEDHRHLYLVTEFIDTDLKRILTNSVLQSVHKLFIGYQIFRALKYIHSAEVMHRDVNPSNILVASNCRIKLADFGLSRNVMEPEMVRKHPLTEYVSTRWYRAPEILLGSTRYNQSIDIWATGCIMCEMLGSKPLFPGASMIGMIEWFIEVLGTPSRLDGGAMQAPYTREMLLSLPFAKPIRPLSHLYPQATDEAIDMFDLCLQWNPAKRLSAEEALTHPYFSSLHNPDDEPSYQMKITTMLADHSKLTVSDYRDQIYADVIEVPRAKRRIMKKLEDLSEQAAESLL